LVSAVACGSANARYFGDMMYVGIIDVSDEFQLPNGFIALREQSTLYVPLERALDALPPVRALGPEVNVASCKVISTRLAGHGRDGMTSPTISMS
jgi:hypothetical protein